MAGEKIYLLTDSVLIDGPDGGHMSGQQLVLGQGGVAGAGTYKTSLPHRIISDNYTLDGLYVGSFVVHAKLQHPAREERKLSVLHIWTHTHTASEGGISLQIIQSEATERSDLAVGQWKLNVIQDVCFFHIP